MDYFYNTAACEGSINIISIGTSMSFCARGNVVLLMRSSMSCLACSFLGFVVITSHFPEVDKRDILSMLVIEGRFSSFSFNPEYIVYSSMLWIGIIVVLWMK